LDKQELFLFKPNYNGMNHSHKGDFPMFKKSLIILCTSFMLWNGAFAEETFPPLTKSVIQDEQKVMEPSQVKQLSEIIVKLPEKFKVFIIPQTEQLSTQEYTDQLFARHKFGDDQVLLVFNRDQEEVAIHAGSVYVAKGLTDEWIESKINHFFVPYAAQRSYMTGISTLVQQLSEDVKNGNLAAQNVEAAATTPLPPVNAEAEESVSTGLPSWLYILIGLVIFISTAGLYVYTKRKRLFKEMDEIEDWMDSIEDKLKQFKVEPLLKKKDKGDPIILFTEKVRKDLLPTAEFTLLESESMCDRFRFGKASLLLKQAKEVLEQIDQDISQLQSKLFQAKVVQDECQQLTAEIIKTCRVVERKLDEARFQYGVSFHELKESLNKVEEWIQSLSEEGKTNNASSLEELKDKKNTLVEILKQIDRFPEVKEEIAVTLEKELNQLQQGLLEMVDNGYQIPNDFQMELEQMQDKASFLLGYLEDGRMESALNGLNGIKERMDAIYDQIEELVTKKNLIHHYLSELPSMLASLNEERKQLKEELEELSLRYRVQEGSIFTYYMELQKVCKYAEDQLYLAEQLNTGNDLEFIQCADMLASVEKSIESVLSLRDQAQQELEELRQGEYDAQDAFLLLQANIARIEQQIRRENLPDTPPALLMMMEEGKESLIEIDRALQQIPLELHRVNQLVKMAKESNAKLIHHAESIFYHCRKAEEKIQQTNRYRSYWKEVNELLTDAETSFRQLDFEKAHLLARQAEELALANRNGQGRSLIKKRKA
jgi:septation ring formation regulator